MKPFDEIARSLHDFLKLGQPPVGVAFRDTVPDAVEAYRGSVPGGCSFWQEATQRVFATVPGDHELCAVGVYTHNLEASQRVQTDLQDALKAFGDLRYVRAEDLPLIPALNRLAKVVVYGPLSSLPVPPDVVLLFAKADQTLILSEAAQQIENGFPIAMGRPACAVIPQAFNSGRAAMSLGCCGARAYLDALTPEIALFAVPEEKIEAFTERVVALAQANETLSAFHSLRRRAIESGARPSIQDSLQAIGYSVCTKI